MKIKYISNPPVRTNKGALDLSDDWYFTNRFLGCVDYKETYATYSTYEAATKTESKVSTGLLYNPSITIGKIVILTRDDPNL